MHAKVSLSAYLKTDLKVAFLLVAFSLGFLVSLVLLVLPLDGELGAYVAACFAPLLLLLALLADSVLMVRRINRAIARGRLFRGEITRVNVIDEYVCLLEIGLDGKKHSRRKAFVFPGTRAQAMVPGSGAAIAEPCLGPLRNPIPLQLLLTRSDPAELLGDSETSPAGPKFSVKPYRWSPTILALLILFCIVSAILIAPLVFWVFQSAGWLLRVVYYPVMFLLSLLLPVLIWYGDFVEVRREGVRVLIRKGNPRLLLWREIQSVEEKSSLTFKHLDVRVADGGVSAWIPLYLQDLDAFLEEVLRVAPEGNPLRHKAEELLRRNHSRLSQRGE